MTLSITSLNDLVPLSPYVKPSLEILRSIMIYDGAHDEGHLIRVSRNALRFGEDKADKDILLPAVLLHDLINVPKSDKENRPKASRMSADVAVEELRKLAPTIPDDICDGIHHAIHAHSYSAKITPATREARCLQDADRLDALGLIGIARCMAVSGIMNRPLFDPIDPLAEHREVDECAWGLDHFQTKLFYLWETMNTSQGRTEAYRLTQKMRRFHKELCQEILGTDVKE